MGRRRNNAVLGFLQGWRAGTEIGNTIKGALMSSDLADAAQSNQVTESVTGEEAANAAQQIQAARDAEIQRQVDAGADPIQAAATVGEQYAPSIGEATRKSNLAQPEFNVGARTFGSRAGAESAADMANTKAQAKVYQRYGEPEKAAKLLAGGLSIQKALQSAADDEELRQAMAGGREAASLQARSSIGSGADITGASNVLGYSESGATGAGQQSGQPGSQSKATRFDFNGYMKTMAPRALETLVKQGRLQEAKAFRDFVDTEEGRNYAELWATGVHRHAIGDSAGALSHFEQLYNAQHYDDGNTVKLVPMEDGKQFRAEQYGPDGKLLGSKTGATADLANQAAAALSPMSLVKFRIEQQAARAKEEGLLDRQLQLEESRMRRTEYQEDRRDERLATRLAAQGNGRVTLTQERGNAEIDAAREAVAGLSPEDIRKRTAPTTATGRENPDFDPSLARAAKLAARRKVGADDWFDRRQGGGQGQPQPQQPAAQTPIAEASSQFAKDPNTKGLRLGNQTPKGFEVLDANGKRVGYYQRQR